MSDRNAPRQINQSQQSRRIDSEDKLISYIRSILGEPMITVDVADEQIRLLIDDTIRKFSDFAYGGEQRIAFTIDAKIDVQDYRLDPRVQAVLSVSLGNSLGTYSMSKGSSGITLGAFGTIGIGYVPHITMQGEASSLAVGGTGAGTGTGTSTPAGVAGGVATGSMADSLTNAYVLRSQRDTLQYLYGIGVNFEYNANTKIMRIFEQIEGPFMVEAAAEYIPNPEYDEIYSHPWIKDYAVAKVKFLWGSITGKYSQSLIGGSEINFADMKSEGQDAMQQLDEDLLNKYTEAFGVFSG